MLTSLRRQLRLDVTSDDITGGSVMSMPQHYVNIFNIRIRIIGIIPGVLENVCGMIKYPPAFDAAV